MGYASICGRSGGWDWDEDVRGQQCKWRRIHAKAVFNYCGGACVGALPDAFLSVERVEAIYVAVRGTEMERVETQISTFGLGNKVHVVEGGDQRQQSVSNALAQLVAENGCSDEMWCWCTMRRGL